MRPGAQETLKSALESDNRNHDDDDTGSVMV